MKVTFLGSGTSQGVPIIACDCRVCNSTDPCDKRLRASILVKYEGQTILVDAGPDFRYQMLRAGVKHLDAILLTHNHKDHTGGLDDIRALNWIEQRPAEIYCEKYVLESLKKEYSYVFQEEKYPGAPEWNINLIDEKPFSINGVEIIPIRGLHYKLPVLGFRFGNFAYCTDMNYIAEEEFSKLKGVEVFVINTVKEGKHISHFSLSEAVEVCRKVGAKMSFLTHISHQLPPHKELADMLPKDIKPAYDGLEIEI
ncbi:MAG: MBL fold metallo-hydrolase [Bacteroidales bacterium]|nr:MBL fold metallo-hydrolase [Bacteroidales bacterium]